MAKWVRVLCSHGVNVNEKAPVWQPGWTQAIEIGIKQAWFRIHIVPALIPYKEQDEYKHVVTSYGAFTYCLARMLLGLAKQGKTPVFAELVKLTAKDMTLLGYDQHPIILGSKADMVTPVQWRGGITAKKAALRVLTNEDLRTQQATIGTLQQGIAR